MAIQKKRNVQTETKLLLEGDESLELPPATVEENKIIVNFPQYQPFVSELLDVLRAGTTAEPVPVMNDEATFAVHGATRTFWIKIWHKANTDLTVIERVQILSCVPSTRDLQIRL